MIKIITAVAAFSLPGVGNAESSPQQLKYLMQDVVSCIMRVGTFTKNETEINGSQDEWSLSSEQIQTIFPNMEYEISYTQYKFLGLSIEDFLIKRTIDTQGTQHAIGDVYYQYGGGDLPNEIQLDGIGYNKVWKQGIGYENGPYTYDMSPVLSPIASLCEDGTGV